MKTATSLPDELYHRAERLVQRLGRSRSASYADALRAYLDGLDDADDVTAPLDALFAAENDTQGRAHGAAAGRRLVDGASGSGEPVRGAVCWPDLAERRGSAPGYRRPRGADGLRLRPGL